MLRISILFSVSLNIEQIKAQAKELSKNSYGEYLAALLKE